MNSLILSGTRGQAWGFDLMIASALFMFGIIVFYFYALNYPAEGQQVISTLSYEGELIADSLLSEGYPLNWTKDDVVRIGITEDSRINEIKLERLYNMVYTDNDYQRTKAILNTQYEYYFTISEPITFQGIPIMEEGIGNNPFVNNNATNLIKVSRFTVYQNKPVALDVYVWE